MISQTITEYKPFKGEKKGGSTDYIYLLNIERSISITNAESLIHRSNELEKIYNQDIRLLDLND